MANKPTRAVLQFKVSLRDIEPPVWRRVQIWQNTKLPHLHRILQLLFNLEDYHLHQFVLGRRTYAVPDPEDDSYERKVIDERRVPVTKLAGRVGAEFTYVYDFGDDWEHQLLLEAIMLPDADAFYPRCVRGERNGPPEDVGGPLGYMEYVDALANGRHPRHKELTGWRGRFDPEDFSLDRINAMLKNAFCTRKASGSKSI
jgi:hypothetical protein